MDLKTPGSLDKRMTTSHEDYKFRCSISDRRITNPPKYELRNQGVTKVTYVTKMESYMVIEYLDGHTKTEVFPESVMHHVVDSNDAGASSRTYKDREFNPPSQ